MSALASTSSWQCNRAARLHDAFVTMERGMEREDCRLVESLHAMSARLKGAELGGGHVLRSSWQTLRTLYYKWIAGDRKATALITDYASPKHVQRLPDALIAEIQKLATTSTRMAATIQHT